MKFPHGVKTVQLNVILSVIFGMEMLWVFPAVTFWFMAHMKPLIRPGGRLLWQVKVGVLLLFTCTVMLPASTRGQMYTQTIALFDHREDRREMNYNHAIWFSQMRIFVPFSVWFLLRFRPNTVPGTSHCCPTWLAQ